MDEFNPDVVIYMARSEVLDQEVDSTWTHLGEPAFDSYVADRFRQAIERPRLARRARRAADLPVLRHRVQPSGSPWPEDDPSRVLTDNQIIESMAGLPSSPSSGASGRRVGIIGLGGCQGEVAPGPPRRGRRAARAGQPVVDGNNGVTVIDAGAWLSPGGHYATTVDGVQARCGDGVHLTVAGGEWLAKRILPVVSLLGRAHQATSPSGSWSGNFALTPPVVVLRAALRRALRFPLTP